jgi:hypothetical protein
VSTFEWVAVAIVTITSAARITRLVTWDKYPPVAWLRSKWRDLTNDGPWSILLECPYCFSMYVAPAVLLWGWFTEFDTVWWLINGSLGAAYLAAIMVRFDGDDD